MNHRYYYDGRCRPSSLSIMILVGLVVAPCTAAAPVLPTLESLHLKDDHGMQSMNEQGNLFVEPDGTVYDLSLLRAYDDLLTSDFRVESQEGLPNQHFLQGSMAILRGIFHGSAVVQAQRSSTGVIKYLEIRHGLRKVDTFAIQIEGYAEGDLLVYTAEQVDQEYFEEFSSDLEEVYLDDVDPNRQLQERNLIRRRTKAKSKDTSSSVEFTDENTADAANFVIPGLPTVVPTAQDTVPGFDSDIEWIPPLGEDNITDDGIIQWIPNDDLPNDVDRDGDGFAYTLGDGTSEDCAFFKVVKVAVLYDAEFCQTYGSTQDTVDRIMMIVASASILYEVDMCVKLKLTNIYTPDSCFASTSLFSTFHRDLACQSGEPDTFLKSIRSWGNDNRNLIGFDPDSTVHAFTGVQPSRIVGCAFVAVVCNSKGSAYGVDYLGVYQNLAVQGVIYAHEMGHNLAARHISVDDSNGFRYIMQARLNFPHDGWSQRSADTILDHLDRDDVICDTIDTGGGTVILTSAPTNVPSISPTPFPTIAPSAVQGSNECTVQQSQITNFCVQATTENGMYACLRLPSVMNVFPGPPGCSLRQPFQLSLQFDACTETGVDDPSNDRLLAGSDDYSEHRQQAALLPSNDGDTVASAAECSTPCVRIGSDICVLASVAAWQPTRSYRVNYSATANGRTQSFVTDIEVEASNDACQKAQTACDEIF